jgi:hypothetical protein
MVTMLGWLKAAMLCRLALQTGPALRIGGGGVRKYLDRYVAPESRVAGAIDLTHAADANCRQNLVRTEAIAGR